MALAHRQIDILNDAGGIASSVNVSVEVRNEETSALATLYSNRAGTTPISNPITVTDGKLDYYVVGGAYKEAMTGVGVSRTLRYVGIGTASEADIEAVGRAGLAFAFEVATTAPPSASSARANNADLSSATKLFITASTLGGTDVSTTLLALAPGSKSVENKVVLTVAGVDASFDVTGATDYTGEATPYVELDVSGHDGASELSAGTMRLNIERSGDDGAGSGDVTGPESSTNNNITVFNAGTGKVIKDIGVGINDVPRNANNLSDMDSASTAFDNIKQSATRSATGAVEEATEAEVYAATNGKFLDAGHLDSAAALVTLTDAPTIALDWAAFINGEVTLTADRTLGNPTNEIPGTIRRVHVKGDDATDRELTFGSEFEGVVPVLDDIDSTQEYILTIYCVAAGHFIASAKLATVV